MPSACEMPTPIDNFNDSVRYLASNEQVKPLHSKRQQHQYDMAIGIFTILLMYVRYFRRQSAGLWKKDMYVELYNKWQDASISVEETNMEWEKIEGILTDER